MAMPEASMHEQDGSMFGKNDIWTTRKLRAMQTEPQPHRVGDPPYCDFRWRILLADLRHPRSMLESHFFDIAAQRRAFTFDFAVVAVDFELRFDKCLLHWRASASANTHGSALPTMSHASSILDVSST
jgi:methionyl-tRNA formyltransferase